MQMTNAHVDEAPRSSYINGISGFEMAYSHQNKCVTVNKKMRMCT